MRPTRVTGFASIALAGCVFAVKFGTGCANVLGIQSERYLVDAGGVVDAASKYPPGWECLAEPPLAPDGGTVKLRYQLLNAATATSGATSGTPITGAPIHACATIDFSCANPLDATNTDDAGNAIFVLPSGFNGFFEMPGAPSFDKSILFRPPQYVNQSQPQGLAPTSDITAAGAVSGVTQDPTLGFAIVSVSDCTGASAAGIAFDMGNASSQCPPGVMGCAQVVYLENQVPNTLATQTDSATGSALVFNVPVAQNGQVESLVVSASFASNGVFIQKITALGRVNWVSYILIEPDHAIRNPF